jgi:hypothetical protein
VTHCVTNSLLCSEPIGHLRAFPQPVA